MKTAHFLSVVIAGAILSIVAVSFAASPIFSDQQICKAAVGAIMGRDPKKIMVMKKEAGIVYLHYIRPDDGSKWAYRCKIEGNIIIWASDTGRWRNNPMDETITYVINGEKLEIVQTFTDGSSSRKNFKASEVGK